MFVGNERKIVMQRQALLEKLKDNLVIHQLEYMSALAAWKEAAFTYGKDLVKRMAKGDYTELGFHLSKPTDNSKDIERAIAMVELSVQGTIELDEPTFNQWVMGEWSWRGRLNEVTLSASAMIGSISGKKR